MLRVEATVVNKLGVHARPSAKITQLASKFKCEVWMAKGARRINAKSIMGVMMLAAAKGSTITIDTEGEQADEALLAIQDLVADRFGEGE